MRFNCAEISFNRMQATRFWWKNVAKWCKWSRVNETLLKTEIFACVKFNTIAFSNSINRGQKLCYQQVRVERSSDWVHCKLREFSWNPHHLCMSQVSEFHYMQLNRFSPDSRKLSCVLWTFRVASKLCLPSHFHNIFPGYTLRKKIAVIIWVLHVRRTYQCASNYIITLPQCSVWHTLFDESDTLSHAQFKHRKW